MKPPQSLRMVPGDAPPSDQRHERQGIEVSKHRIHLAGVIVLALTGVAALPGTAAASWHDRDCSQAGLVFGPANADGTDPYEDESRFHVSIRPTVAAAIARSWVPLGIAARLHTVPCVVGTSIVATASQGWLHWSGDSGQINVKRGTAINYTTYPVGRFHCTSTPLKAPRVAAVNCVGRHGAIRASFTIRRNPYYS